MGPVEGLVYGLGIAVAPTNLLACFIGVLIGTIVGVLPGIGPVGAMALLLPSTFALHPATALIMLAGIYYGSRYGGTTTSILVNVPGEAASVSLALLAIGAAVLLVPPLVATLRRRNAQPAVAAGEG
jgi:putative tricarboxylic transport membrane protein